MGCSQSKHDAAESAHGAGEGVRHSPPTLSNGYQPDGTTEGTFILNVQNLGPADKLAPSDSNSSLLHWLSDVWPSRKHESGKPRSASTPRGSIAFTPRGSIASTPRGSILSFKGPPSPLKDSHVREVTLEAAIIETETEATKEEIADAIHQLEQVEKKEGDERMWQRHPAKHATL
mmetsp:Transcript_28059/g.46630  ORF Transcript_28059/g.46630 Transcript_28059/m.46630 type:complete len:175 (-) Transcript_28059:503-1027(-)